MESIRQSVLQAELKRIEDEAQAKSFAVMNKADHLAEAHLFCATIRRALHFPYSIEVAPVYTPPHYGCDITVHTDGSAKQVLHAAHELGISWTEDEDATGAGQHVLRFDGFERVKVLFSAGSLATFHHELKRMQAAA